jgi:hypothetical protein
MSKTAQHQALHQDGSQAVIDALSTINFAGLSYVQLHRLQKILQQASADVAVEVRHRAESDASGDTVKVPSPNL